MLQGRYRAILPRLRRRFSLDPSLELSWPPTRIGTDPHELTSHTHDSRELDAAPRFHPVIADLCLLSRRLVGAALDYGTRSSGADQPVYCRSADQ